METWQVLVGFLGGPTLVVIALRAFEWRAREQYRKEVKSMQNDIAWLNKDLAEVKKDVEWLVWHFKEKKDS